MVNLRQLAKKEERLGPGHRMCPGCPQTMIVRLVTKATDSPVVVANATGCLEVSTTIYPFSAWRVPWIHNAFENSAATISGVEAAYKALKKKGKIDKDVKFLVFAGDGGTYDIGLQSLSGALERGHNFVYVCLDNEGYMNTGIQRSSATPFGAWTNTSQVGSILKGKQEFKKDLTSVVASHHIPYVAQASPSNVQDLFKKAKKAFETEGPAFINVLAPCVPGWKYPSEQSMEIARLAVDSCFWPLYEIENGKYTLNYDPGEKKIPIIKWLEKQKRFRHLLKPENQHIVEKLQQHVDAMWENIKRLSEN
ncbi:pyruvate ferredoxin oxidoreductase [Candidatus Woesearchaeota archaeon]|nr:MAG: pyruvate ferredoxin oxidoreductase [Candidatus Woesearchaeota archaeon]